MTAPDHAPWFEESSSYVQDTGWQGREALNSSPDRDDTICVYRQGASCVRPVATVPGASTVSGPVGSPDGSRIVLTAGFGDPAVYRVVLVDPATAAPIRELTSGPADFAESWSPDGTAVAFTRDGSTWVVPADGSAPPRQLVAGLTSAAWGRDPAASTPAPPAGGGSTAGPAALRTRTVRATRAGRIRLKLRCRAAGGCPRQRWRITRRGRRLATVRVPALENGASRTVMAKLSASGRRALRRSSSGRMQVRLLRPGRPAITLTIRR